MSILHIYIIYIYICIYFYLFIYLNVYIYTHTYIVFYVLEGLQDITRHMGMQRFVCMCAPFFPGWKHLTVRIPQKKKQWEP